MQINYKAKPRIERISDGVPLLVIDNFYLNPDQVRQQAFDGEFPHSKAGYPGRHQPLDRNDDQVLELITYVREVVQLAANVKIPLESIWTDFSILTTPRNKVLKLQSHPHIDGTALAGLVYLNPKPMGGTCFYHNKRLNSCVVTDKNRAQWDALTESKDESFAEVDDYVSDSFDMWEKIYSTNGDYNQFVCYPSNIFHSVDVVIDPDPSKPKESRLTQRIFIEQLTHK